MNTNVPVIGIGIARAPSPKGMGVSLDFIVRHVDIAVLRHNEDPLSQVQDQAVHGPGARVPAELVGAELEDVLAGLGSSTYAWIVVGPDALSISELAALRARAARPDYVHVCASHEEWRRELTGQTNAAALTVRTAIARRVDLTTLPRVDSVLEPALGLAVHAIARSQRGQSKGLEAAS